MRLLLISQTFAQFGGDGPTTHVRGLAQRLVGHGHRVTVLAAHFPCRDTPFAPAGGAPEVVILPTVWRYRNATVNPGVVTFCARRLREFDLAHVFGLYDLLSPLPIWLCRRWEIPHLLEPMGMYPPRVTGLRAKQLFNLTVGRQLLRGAARIVATSELEHAQLVAAGIGAERVVVRRNGVDVSEVSDGDPGRFRARWTIPDTAPLIAYLGRLAPVKGLETLLDAFAATRPASAYLALIGPEDAAGYRRRLHTLAAALNVTPRVRFTGPLFGAEKAAALRAANVFVLPSLSENFGVAAAEAMACGTPVVITDRCGIAPLVAGRAGVVVSADAGGLRHGLEQVLQNAGLASRLGAEARRIGAGLSWDEPVAHMESIYAEVLREHRASRPAA